MLTTNILKTIFILACLIQTSLNFMINEEVDYMNKFKNLIRDSHSETPQDLINTCGEKGSQNAQTEYIRSSTTSKDIQNRCLNAICQIEPNVQITMNSNLNVAALIVKGKLIWDESTQQTNEQWLCAGYIAVNLLIFLLKSK